MRQENSSTKLFCLVLHTTVLTAGGSATTQVVKSHGSHVPVETSGAECMGTCCRDTVVSLVLLFWFTEHITVVSWLCDETVAGSDMRLQSADLWCKAQFVSFGPSMHTVQCLCCSTT